MQDQATRILPNLCGFDSRVLGAANQAAPRLRFCARTLTRTIEPKKNHLLVLHVWRRLVAELGDTAPKLVLVGARGWENEHIVDMLERCPSIQRHVVEVSGLETPALRRLLSGARAALMPTFAEGYGLPLVEALAAGTPVIASDIPVFSEVGGDFIVRLDPTDGPAWQRTILEFSQEPSPERRKQQVALARYRPPAWEPFFTSIEDFITDLPLRRPS